ncbi:type IV pilin protein [Oceanivirga salmonicida]|uniref:type IV pilin protein n=1 Tax=Oceanivirga salmonicida TaxID=1769291 RepID=UPI00083781A5|nr:type II secretion system protein [Oceanivirga salmonicida]
MKNKKKKNYGFTLIELIAVMAIMAIISTIAVPKISRYINAANRTKVIAAVSELNNFLVSENLSNETNISNLLSKYQDLNSLQINLKSDGSFKIGNVSGNLKINNNFVNAILKEPKEFSNQVIGPNSNHDNF